jgi:hypothetical protein
MAGQQLTAEQIAAAGQQAAANQQQAAPAQNQQQQQAPAANQQQPAPGNSQQPPAQEFIMNQEQFNQRFAEKMGAMERELGLPQGGLKDFVAAQKAAQKPKAPAGEALSGADLKLARMEALMTAGVPSKQIPLLLQHLNISGKTREEIAGSVQALIDLKLLTIDAPAQQGTQQQGPPNAAQGAGNQGVPGTPGKKTWKKSEISKTLTNPASVDPAVLAEINQAQQEGRVDYNS